MIFDVKFDPKAERQLERLPKNIAQRIVKKIRYVAETGRGTETLKEEAYGYKIRVGDYRVLIDLAFNPNIIWIRYVDHRSRVYK